jgi:spore germination cell wall hydrolase CwlJ-like protein
MPNDPELEMLARLLYGENRQDMTPDEAAGIASVVRNRAALQGWPATPKEVMLQPHQFQPLSPRGTPASQANADISASFGEGDPRWQEYMTLAQYGMQPATPASPYTHYWSGDKRPGWAAKLEGVTKIGRHYFGRERGRKPKAKPKAK